MSVGVLRVDSDMLMYLYLAEVKPSRRMYTVGKRHSSYVCVGWATKSRCCFRSGKIVSTSRPTIYMVCSKFIGGIGNNKKLLPLDVETSSNSMKQYEIPISNQLHLKFGQFSFPSVPVLIRAPLKK